MAIIKNVLLEEHGRLKEMEEAYKEKLENLPKGCIVMKKIKGNQYPYLSYREGSKVKTKYIRKTDLAEVRRQLQLRNKYNNALKEIRKDFKLINKVL